MMDLERGLSLMGGEGEEERERREGGEVRPFYGVVQEIN
jgi:hypothetical protein